MSRRWNNCEEFAQALPERVNRKTLEAVAAKLKESPLKSLLRKIYSLLLCKRYAIPLMGEGFQWGYHWHISKNVLKIGHYAYIGSGVSILYPTILGDLCMIGNGVQFVGNDHGIDLPMLPTRISPPKVDQTSVLTKLGADVWIGQNAIIFSGVTLGRGCVVASGSVVTKDVEPYAVVAGVPAKFLRYRFETDQERSEHDKALFA